MKTTHPEWALAHKKPGCELRLIRGKYYLYEYKTVYDKVKKGPRKISGPLLGSITENEGFIPSSKRELEQGVVVKFNDMQCKEYGISHLITSQFSEYMKAMEMAFPNEWKELVAIAYCRFVYRCPLKSIPFRLASSYLPELLSIKPFSEKQSSELLNRIGNQRSKMLEYMRSFRRDGEHILMDATDVFSSSKNISLSKTGYSKNMQYEPLFNLMYIYSSQSRMPLYYRLLPGNIRDVKAFKNCLLEAGLQKAVIVADKGFYSEANVTLLQSEQLAFILPLKRDSHLIDYQDLSQNTFKKGDSFFEHEKRMIWYQITPLENGLFLYMFLDESLRVKEDMDYLIRTKTVPENFSIEKYHDHKHKFGTLTFLSPVEGTAQSIYETYKSRMEIESLFDTMKNLLESDHTYMQNDQTLEGWMFINHITLQWYQHLYIDLKEKNLLKKISVNDVIQLLTDVKKIRINDKWYLNEYTTHTRKLMEKIGVVLP